MDETANQIEHEIAVERERLSQNLKHLEKKIQGATDRRTHFEQRPLTAVGAAFTLGFLLALATTRRSPAG